MQFKLENIEFKEKEETILSIDDLKIKKSQHLLLLGSSGCGKTTLLNLMAGLLKPTSGEIIYEGTKYPSLSNKEMDYLRSNNFGFIFQNLHLIKHLSVSQNISLAQGKNTSKNINDLIDTLNLTGKENQKARDLSYGEAQRVSIARAVANNPKVIFADEPTSALDDINALKVMDLIFSQAKETGATVIAATHDSRIKKYFDKVWEMGS